MNAQGRVPRYITGASIGSKAVVRLKVIEALGAGLFITAPTKRTLRTRKGRRALGGNSANRKYQLTTCHGLFATCSDDLEGLRDFAVALASMPQWPDVVDAIDAETALRIWAEFDRDEKKALNPQAVALTLDSEGQS